MSCNTHDPSRNQFMLVGELAEQGYDWWWHSFTGHDVLTGEERSFFIEFFCVNPALGCGVPLFGTHHGQTSPGLHTDELGRPSYLMVKVGTWGRGAKQLHRFFAWDDVEMGSGAPYYVRAEECLACDTDLIGRVEVTPEEATAHPEWMCDAGSMIWDLRLDKQVAYNVGYGASEPMRDSGAFEMFWHVEGMKTEMSGTVILDGVTYVVSGPTSYGYADKNWGRDFTSPWLWLASSNLTSALTNRKLTNSAFVIGGGCPKIGPVALDRKLLGCMFYEGVGYEFNFSKPWTGSRTSFSCEETADEIRWHVQQQTLTAILKTEISCPKDEMLLINYESPDGFKRHKRLWNGGTGRGCVQLFRKHAGMGLGNLLLVDEIVAENVGCEYGVYDDPE